MRLFFTESVAHQLLSSSEFLGDNKQQQDAFIRIATSEAYLKCILNQEQFVRIHRSCISKERRADAPPLELLPLDALASIPTINIVEATGDRRSARQCNPQDCHFRRRGRLLLAVARRHASAP
jgi:hypothetical protein